jgi:hypothetical protein
LKITLFVYSIKQYSINAHGGVKAARHIPDIGSELHNQEVPNLFKVSNIIRAVISRRLQRVVFVAYLEHTKINYNFGGDRTTSQSNNKREGCYYDSFQQNCCGNYFDISGAGPSGVHASCLVNWLSKYLFTVRDVVTY